MTMNSLPRRFQLVKPVVSAFRDLDGSADNAQLVEKVAELLDLSDELVAQLHGDGPKTELYYRIGWVKTWLKKSGMLNNPQRGVWVLTKYGRSATEEEIEERINEVRREYRSSRASGNTEDAGEQGEDASVAEEGDETRDDRWQSELLNAILQMEPSAFERLIQLLLRRLGFSDVEVTGRSGDGGIDLRGIFKANRLLSFRVLVQCKRYRGTVGPEEIRGFRGAMTEQTDKGVFITSGLYTRGAKEEATSEGKPPIDLIDGEALVELLKDMEMGVDVREKVTVHRNYFLDF
ncbi:MAG: restriction endonuclease [Alphaproteobacteria bacterium]|nr:restriction endonuclease [Alphaproteobacteria bacterium]MDA8005003.1 restriction endonuclease [Alphaproteobacteria bacterium]MDA8013275.1 restriction endonuclease [Alphaproteobacteria bacterium]